MNFIEIFNYLAKAIDNRKETDLVFLLDSTSPPHGLIMSLALGVGNIYSSAIFKGM
jgi:hypothetical protein